MSDKKIYLLLPRISWEERIEESSATKKVIARYECLADVNDLSNGYLEFTCNHTRTPSPMVSLGGPNGKEILQEYQQGMIRKARFITAELPLVESFNFSIGISDLDRVIGDKFNDLSPDKRTHALYEVEEEIQEEIHDLFGINN